MDKAIWRDFVTLHPNGNIFQAPEMFNVYKATKNYKPIVLLVLNERNEMVAIMQVVVQKEFTGPAALPTSRAIITGGPLLETECQETCNILLKEYKKMIKDKAVYTQVRNCYSQEGLKECFEQNGYSYKEHLNIILDLRIGQEALWEKFSRSRKKGIRKALNGSFSFEFSQDLESIKKFFILLKVTYRKIRLPFPEEEHFFNISRELQPENYMIFIIRKDNQPVVSLFTLIFKKTMYAYYMGSVNDGSTMKEKPVDLLFWEVFKWAIARGIEYFDWMGAGSPGKDYGVRDFKLEYGGELQNFGRFEMIHMPLLYNFSKTGLKIWRKFK
ncbi:MAG: GNAT family N-acetyltransferase [Bacteroidales bacterium]|nr:GNAT family N-acetyltransferase [Bacteroidales bacterium]